LKIDTAFQEDHQVKLIVEIEPETLESSKRRAAKQIAKKVKIPGFRPGKAPYNVIQKHVGDAVVLEDAIELLLEDIYPKVIEETEIEPYGPGSLENIASMEPPTFEILVPLSPIVDLEDYHDIRIEFETREVSEDDINQVIENLRDKQATIEPVERQVQEGDMVYITLSGEQKGGEDEEKKTLVEERRLPVIADKEDVDTTTEYPFPGFSRKLIDMAAGDEKTIEYKFGNDYEYEELRGLTGVYKVEVEEVKSRNLPEVTDDFAKSVGEYETVNEMIEDIKKNLASRLEAEQNAEYETQIIDKLIEQADIKYPPQMVSHEIDHFIEDLERQLARQGMTIDLYLKSQEKEMDDIREEVKPNAEKRLKRGLILMEVANKEDISVSPEEVEEKTQQALTEIQQVLPEDEARKFTKGEALQGLVSRIITDEITSRTLERLRLIAKGEEIKQGDEESDETEENSEITEINGKQKEEKTKKPNNIKEDNEVDIRN